MRRYAYYPGCSVKGTGKPYEESLLAVLEGLGVDWREIDDWNCCGATAYMSIDEDQAVALASRNLALAEAEAGDGNGTDDAVDILTPCNACYLVLLKTQDRLSTPGKVRRRVTRALDSTGLHYRGTARVRHPLDVLTNDVGLETIRTNIQHSLEHLKVAPYYGCQIVRPYALFDSQDDPRTMDEILRAAGCQIVDYPFKTRCCGGSQTGTLPEIGLELVYDLIAAARARGAETIATICPLCQFNLEVYQDQVVRKFGIEPMPVVYFTQLLGLALGISPERLGLHRSLVPIEGLLSRSAAHVD